MTRNRQQEAQTNQTEIQAGYKSRQMAAQEQGYDWEQVEQDNEAYAEQHGQGDGQPLPLPAAGDDEQDGAVSQPGDGGLGDMLSGLEGERAGLGSLLEQAMLEVGFTGETKEKGTGRRHCFQNGKPVPCPDKPGSQVKKKAKQAAAGATAAGATVEPEAKAKAKGWRAGLAQWAGALVPQKLKTAMQTVGSYAGVAKEWATDKKVVEGNIAKICAPKPSCKTGAALKALWWAQRGGTATLFATYTAGQAVAGAIADQKDMTPEQAKHLKHTLAHWDIHALEGTKLHWGASLLVHIALPGVAHAVIEAPLVMPVASMGYIAYSMVRNPVATYRAARQAVKTAGEAITAGVGKVSPRAAAALGTRLGEAASDEAPAWVGTLADRIKEHDGADWYLALFHAAWQETQDAVQALELADAAYAEQSTSPEEEGGGL